jgi:hypothetical protein
MPVPVPHGWEIGLMVLGIAGAVVAMAASGRLATLRWPAQFAGLALFVGGATLVFAAPTALVAQAPIAPVAQHFNFVSEGAHTSLTIYDQPEGGGEAPTLAPAYFSLPPHATVTLTIVSFDTSASPPAAYYSGVRGTIGGVETVNGRVVSRLPVVDIAHTVTVPALGVNVPVPAARKGHPVRVVVTLTTPGPGTYEWLCMCPCGLSQGGWGYPMEQAGMMRGLIRVS